MAGGRSPSKIFGHFLETTTFNDTAINYRFVAIQNAQNEVVELDNQF